MCVFLAGLLLGAQYSFLYAISNATIVTLFLYHYFSRAGVTIEVNPFYDTLSTAVPVTSFLLIVAVITWLYQRSLDQSEARLSLARGRIMQDELLRRDLAIARELQQRLYPPPPMTDRALQIASRSEPARETSGDFYDFIDLDDGQLGIVVADVTGKSIAAALLMALARGTLRSAAPPHSSPAEVLFTANEALCRDQTARQMITAFYGILDTRTLTLRFANAGHPYPILRRGAGVEETELGGMPLGAMDESQYVEGEIALQPGDQLYIISDGLVEERNARRELFGYERLCAAIQAADPSEPERALDDLWRAVSAFRGATDQDDDITLVVIQATQVIDQPPLPAPVERDQRRG
jgi:serine phosphatase RsbU (regulator of sigma subunit)